MSSGSCSKPAATIKANAITRVVLSMTAGLRDDFTAEQPRDYLTTTPTTLAAWSSANLR
jgi:hypothetical protein